MKHRNVIANFKVMMMTLQNSASQVRIHTLCAAMNVCNAQLRNLIRSGQVPPPDFYQHGKHSYWKLATIRAWRPDIADVVIAINTIPLNSAA